jgi:hypothetical protein
MVKRGEEYIPKITGFGSSVAGAGTPTYASPEQSGGNAVGKNSDLWSFGVIAYQTFTGELPFAGGEQALSAINGIDEPWQQLILACLVPDPKKRVKDCTECIAILKGETWGESKQQEVCNEDKTIETQKPELWPKLEQESWSKPKPWTKSEQEPWSKPKPWTKSEQNPTPKPILEPQPKPKSEPKSKPEPKSESEPKSEKKTKSLTHKLLKNLITVIIAGIAVISNPSEEEHKKAAKPVLKQILTKEEINKIIHGKTFLEGIMNNEILSEIMLDAVYNELIARENYILFSTTTVTFGGKTERIGIGAFGKVWIPKPKP